MDNPRIISEQVFGSSKKIQFIGMSPMETLLNAVNCADRIDTSENSTHNSSSNSSPRTMSIESILDTDYPKPSPSPRPPTTISKPVNTFEPEKRRWMHSSEDVPTTHERSNKVRRMVSSPPQRMTTLTCLHAAVAQKSYGSEKRFLCPPPVVTIQGESATHPLVSMAVMCENGDRFLEQKILLDETKHGSFKYLHVAGTAKAKQFHLRVSLAHGAPAHNGSSPSSSTSSSINKPTSPPPPSQPYVTFFSCPISIISKPSKKTSKARNVSSCIVANSSVSLFNRINSQTVRTKYMTTENGQLCAKNSSWAPFDIIVLRQPNKPQQGVDDLTSPPTNAPVTYGSEIMLKDTQTGVLSPRMIIRKVDKGYIAPNASGPVSQMQKIALQLMPTSDNSNDESMYLSAKASEDTNTTATWLEFATSKRNADDQEKVDDYLCWTIVGIAKFEYSYIEPALPNNAEWGTSPSPSSPIMSSGAGGGMHDNNSSTSLYQQYNNGNARHPQLSPPPSPPRRIVPLPLIDDVRYSPHRIELTGQHFHSFEFWIGSQGPLKPLDQTPQSMVLDLPPTQDLLVAHHDLLVARSDGSRYLELPLVLKHQQDGNTFSSGKGLACDILPNGDAGQWSVIAMHTPPSSSSSSAPSSS